MRRYIYILFARKWIVITALLMVFLGTTIITFSTPPTYQATATIYVEQKVEQQMFAPPPLSGPDIRIFLQTQLELISSRTVAQRTIHELGMDKKCKNPLELAKMIDNLRARITAGSRTGIRSEPSEAGLGHSFILFVSVNDSDPVQAVSLVNVICQKYQEFFFEVKGARNVKAYDFLKDHLKTIEADMRRSDNKLRDFELTQGKDLLELINMQKGSVAIYDDFSNFLEEYNKRTVELNTVQVRLQGIKDQLGQQNIKNIPADYMNRGKPVVFIQEKIISIESNLADLKSRYTDEYIPITQAQDKKKRLEDVQQDTMRGNLLDQFLQVEMELAEARERVNSLRTINDEYARKLDKLVNAKTTYTQLMREQEAADKVYLKHIEELENSRLTMFSDLSKVANVYILDEAFLPVPKIRPKVKVNIFLSLVIGLLLGIGLAFFADYLDHTIKSVEDVDYYLKQPLLMSLPTLVREMKE